MMSKSTIAWPLAQFLTFSLLSRRECEGAHDGFVMPVSTLIPSLHLFVKPLDLVFESHEYC